MYKFNLKTERMIETMKKEFMKIISCILAIVIFLPTVALLPVVAEEDAYDLRGTTFMLNLCPFFRYVLIYLQKYGNMLVAHNIGWRWYQ